jgi:hypothetical protein
LRVCSIVVGRQPPRIAATIVALGSGAGAVVDLRP